MGEVKFKLKPVEKIKMLVKKGGNTGDMWIVFNTKKQGLETVMRDYSVMAMRFLWERGEEGAISREIWLHVNKLLMEKERSISRATIINVMNDMVDAGILNYKEKPGKGGYHKIYSPAFDEEGFKEHIARQIIEKLLEAFPDEVDEAIRKILEKKTIRMW